jgi:hypothetical protein
MWRMADDAYGLGTVWSITTTRKERKKKAENEMCFVFIRMQLMCLDFVNVR